METKIGQLRTKEAEKPEVVKCKRVAEPEQSRAIGFPAGMMRIGLPEQLPVVAGKEHDLATKRMTGQSLGVVRIALYEGAVDVGGKKVKLPKGIASTMTGSQFKELAGIYRGNRLFIRRGEGLVRIRDFEKVEVMSDSKFEDKPKPLKIRSYPLPSRD